jgi:hypothetical protein
MTAGHLESRIGVLGHQVGFGCTPQSIQSLTDYVAPEQMHLFAGYDRNSW